MGRVLQALNLVLSLGAPSSLEGLDKEKRRATGATNKVLNAHGICDLEPFFGFAPLSEPLLCFQGWVSPRTAILVSYRTSLSFPTGTLKLGGAGMVLVLGLQGLY